jgi:hypothetical protein
LLPHPAPSCTPFLLLLLLLLQYKPFTIKQDMIKQAMAVADALSQSFEVRRGNGVLSLRQC